MKITRVSQLTLAVAIMLSNTLSLPLSAKVLNGQASQLRIQRNQPKQENLESGLIQGDAMSAFSTPATTPVANTQKPAPLIDSAVYTTRPKSRPLSGGATSLAGLSEEDVVALAKNDIAILIDKSSSMKEHVMPLNISRWDWCRNQLFDLTQRTAGVTVKDIDVLLFSSDYQVFPKVDFNSVKSVFANNNPSGGTRLDPALTAVFSEHFMRKNAGSTKKLKVIIISDCMPPVGFIPIGTVAGQVSNPQEISVTYLNMVSGSAFVSAFSATSNPNIQVDVQPFEVMAKPGLTQTILQIIKRKQ